MLWTSARRRAAAKRKKLKHLGKSRSTDTEDEENEDEPDEGNIHLTQYPSHLHISKTILVRSISVYERGISVK